MTYVQDAVPTIIFHGTKDTVVPFSHTQWLQKAMIEYGHIIEVYPVENENHVFPSITTEKSKEIADNLIRFLNKYL